MLLVVVVVVVEGEMVDEVGDVCMLFVNVIQSFSFNNLMCWFVCTFVFESSSLLKKFTLFLL